MRFLIAFLFGMGSLAGVRFIDQEAVQQTLTPEATWAGDNGNIIPKPLTAPDNGNIIP